MVGHCVVAAQHVARRGVWVCVACVASVAGRRSWHRWHCTCPIADLHFVCLRFNGKFKFISGFNCGNAMHTATASVCVCVCVGHVCGNKCLIPSCLVIWQDLANYLLYILIFIILFLFFFILRCSFAYASFPAYSLIVFNLP